MSSSADSICVEKHVLCCLLVGWLPGFVSVVCGFCLCFSYWAMQNSDFQYRTVQFTAWGMMHLCVGLAPEAAESFLDCF